MLASILSWLINLEISIGNGLRNELAEALAVKRYKTHANLCKPCLCSFFSGHFICILIYFAIHGFLNLVEPLQTAKEYILLLNTLILCIIVLFLVQF